MTGLTPKTLVDSDSDQRVVNNSMRHRYKVLDDDEKRQMVAVKDLGLDFVRLLHSIGGTLPSDDQSFDRIPQRSRDLALAQTHIEDAVMRAVRHITG